MLDDAGQSLWLDTITKDPKASEVLYVEALAAALANTR